MGEKEKWYTVYSDEWGMYITVSAPYALFVFAGPFDDFELACETTASYNKRGWSRDDFNEE